MAKQPQRRRAAASKQRFTPVPTRKRHDGWTPDRQIDFIDALAESGCVEEACAAVGVSRQSAYRLRTRPEAQAFRMAWDKALDLAIRRLSDACYARALHGEAVPHFYQGQQVGEHRRYDNRLAMFLLRYRDPLRYAATLDQMVYSGDPEYAAIGFSKLRNRILDEGHGFGVDWQGDEGPDLWTAEPKAAVTARQREELQARSGEFGGSYERRQRLTALRAKLAAEDRAREEAERVARGEEDPEAKWDRLGAEIRAAYAAQVARQASSAAAGEALSGSRAGGDVVSPLSPFAAPDQAAGAAQAAGRPARSQAAMPATASSSPIEGSKPAARIRSIL